MTANGQWPAGAGDATTVMPRPAGVEPARRRVRRHVHAHDGECPRHCGGMTAVAAWLRRWWRPRLYQTILIAWIAGIVTYTSWYLTADASARREDERLLGCQLLVNQADQFRRPVPRPSICDDVAIGVRLGQQPTPTPAPTAKR